MHWLERTPPEPIPSPQVDTTGLSEEDIAKLAAMRQAAKKKQDEQSKNIIQVWPWLILR